jgi:hypothetical protein
LIGWILTCWTPPGGPDWVLKAEKGDPAQPERGFQNEKGDPA